MPVFTNDNFINRVADVAGGHVNAVIVGWAPNGGANQVFNFEPQGGNANLISYIAADGAILHVSSPDPIPGSQLTVAAGGVGSVYTVVNHAPGQVKFSILSADGVAPLYWTLTNGHEGTPISLQLDNGHANQIWGVGDN